MSGIDSYNADHQTTDNINTQKYQTADRVQVQEKYQTADRVQVQEKYQTADRVQERGNL